MIQYPNIDPEIFSIWKISIRWYSMMYIVGFTAGYFLIRKLLKLKNVKMDDETYENLLFYAFLGVIAGGRIGYILFYNLPFYIKQPLEVLKVWHGGMSFHGGLIGVVLGLFYFARKNKIHFYKITDAVVTAAPIGLFFGRIGNFINGELYGRTADLPWAMIFPDAGPLPRHPSQLYESLFEGLILFIILWSLRKSFNKAGIISGLFLILYGVFRFFIEFTREPDPQLGLFFNAVSMGQILCIAMVIAGTAVIYSAEKMKILYAKKD